MPSGEANGLSFCGDVLLRNQLQLRELLASSQATMTVTWSSLKKILVSSHGRCPNRFGDRLARFPRRYAEPIEVRFYP